MNTYFVGKSRTVLIACLVVVLFALCWFGHQWLLFSSKKSRTYPVREDSEQYKFINPLVLLDNSSVNYDELNPLKNQIQEFIDEEINKGNVSRTSFYFRDLNSGMWTGVYPDERFVPASLLKVMTVIVYLRAAENDSKAMDQKLFYKKTLNQNQIYPPESKLADGYYTVGKLINQAIIESDNDAAYALYKNKENEHNQLYKTLRLPVPPEKVDNFMSPRDVSAIFRTLYGSTYLLNDYSEQVLELLTLTNFKKGILQGTNQNIKVAHKFGEYSVYNEGDTAPNYQLHDCGIVYYPNKPYFICVMTEGKNLENLEGVISTVSSRTLGFVENFTLGE